MGLQAVVRSGTVVSARSPDQVSSFGGATSAEGSYTCGRRRSLPQIVQRVICTTSSAWMTTAWLILVAAVRPVTTQSRGVLERPVARRRGMGLRVQVEEEAGLGARLLLLTRQAHLHQRVPLASSREPVVALRGDRVRLPRTLQKANGARWAPMELREQGPVALLPPSLR